MMPKDELIETRGKYAELIDEETWMFIDKTNASYPENAVDLPLQEQCDLYDQMCEQFRAAHPDGVVATDGGIETTNYTIPIRQYQLESAEPNAQILFLHGGGFVVGGLESFTWAALSYGLLAAFLFWK